MNKKEIKELENLSKEELQTLVVCERKATNKAVQEAESFKNLNNILTKEEENLRKIINNRNKELEGLAEKIKTYERFLNIIEKMINKDGYIFPSGRII